MLALIGRSGNRSARRWRSARIRSKERRYNNNMDDNKYNTAVELLKNDLIETATEMGLDVEWFKQEVIADEYCMSFLGSEIAEKMLEVA